LFTYYDNTTGSEIACVQVSLSNGVTTQLPAIPWATGSIALVIILASGVAGVASSFAIQGSGHAVQASSASPHATTTANAHTTTTAEGHVAAGHSNPPVHRLDPTTVFLHFQSISTTGLLSLNYPPIYKAFTVNFAWANFIIPLGAFRRAAERMRKCDLPAPTPDTTQFSLSSLPPTVSSNSTATKIATGIPAYAAKLNISYQDLFGLIAFTFLCVLAVLLSIFWLVGLVIQIKVWRASQPERKAVWVERRTRWGQMSSNNTLRLVSNLVGMKCSR
jgi:hypothetical protein